MENKTGLRRANSVDGGALEELVQCGICLEKLNDSRMLPCQHTFCLSCLQTHLLANHYPDKFASPSVEDLKQTIMVQKVIAIKCPMCQQNYNLEKGFDSLELLPKNLYIASLLKLIEAGNSNELLSSEEKCFKCGNLSTNKTCQHCVNIFCSDCYESHLSELQASSGILLKQIENSQLVLEHKYENFENRCDQLAETVKETALKKIEEIRGREDSVLAEIVSLQSERKIIYTNLNNEIAALKDAIAQSRNGNNPFLHREIAKILRQVSHFSEIRAIFDQEAFQLDEDSEGIYQDIEDGNSSELVLNCSSLESVEGAITFYKQNEFIPKFVWNKCPRPGNVAIPPWNQNRLYVAATDTRTVLVLDRTTNKLEKRLTSPNMLFPYGIACSDEEIFISDTWQHCIHVFSKNDEYLRTFLSKGNGESNVRMPAGLAIHQNNLIIADTGNNRVLVVDGQTGAYISTIGTINRKRTLNMPMSVAYLGNGKIVVADSGNHRMKIFKLSSGEKLQEFGSMGRCIGQFRSAETVAVDPLGLILVGDAGNGRVQIFKKDGSLVKVFGKNMGFGWVSGILVTKELEIITTDIKARCLRIF